MSDKPAASSSSSSCGGSIALAIALLVIFCYGDPDLLDSLIHWLRASAAAQGK